MTNDDFSLVYKVLNGHVYHGELISLKPLKLSQIEEVRVWRNSQIKVLRQTNEISADSQIAYFEKMVIPELESNNPSQILFAIYMSKSFKGYGGITNIDWNILKGEISFLLSPLCVEGSQNFRDVFTEFLTVIKTIAFETIGLNKLSSETYSFRKSVIETLSENGFELEGIIKMSSKKQNEIFDSFFHAIFNPRIEGVY